MPVLLGVLCIVIALYGYNKTKYVFNPITAMFIMWGLILPFSCWGLYDTVVPSDKVYFIITIGLVAYLIGTMLGTKPVEYSLGILKTSIVREYKFNYYLIYILFLVSAVYYLFQLVIVVGLLRSGFDYTYIRNLTTATEENVLRSSALITVTKAFVATPVTYLSLALLPFEILKKKKNWFVVIGSIVLMMMYLLTTGGRSVLLWCALYFVAAILMQKNLIDYGMLRRYMRKYRKIIIVGGVTLLIVLLKMTFARKGSDTDLLKQVYIYFVCPLQNLDYHLNVVDSSRVYGYGLSSFYGLIYPILFVLSKLGFKVFTPHLETIYAMSFQDLQMGYDIGGGIYMNAFVTAFYQPYLDGRYIGVILVMIIFGFASGRAFYSAFYKQNKKALLIYLLLLQKIIFSFVRFYFTQQAQSFCFLLAFLIIIQWRKNERRDKIISFL